MFWGLIMEPQRRYTQKVKKAFHISMASLDISTSSEEPAQVMCGIQGRNYLLCTLRKPDIMQCPLDLNFSVGSELSFAANGKCHVHLTGYLIEDYPEFAEEEESEESEVDLEETVKKKKRTNKNEKNGPAAKKSKVVETEDVSSDESDVNVEDLLHKSFEEDENDDTYVEDEGEEDGEEEEESDDDNEEEEDVEEEESSLSDSEEEEESNPAESPKKRNIKMNGISSKDQSTPKVAKENKKTKKENKSPGSESKTPNKESKTPNKDSKTPNKETKPNKQTKETQSPKKKTLQGGVIIEEIKEGQGPMAKAGKFVTVYYEGRLKQNNKMFDSTTKGSGFSFRLGGGEVIKGWDIGVAGMKLGGKRRIICPPAMAYGAKGSPPAIPANSTLVFEVEMKKMR